MWKDIRHNLYKFSEKSVFFKIRELIMIAVWAMEMVMNTELTYGTYFLDSRTASEYLLVEQESV